MDKKMLTGCPVLKYFVWIGLFCLRPASSSRLFLFGIHNFCFDFLLSFFLTIMNADETYVYDDEVSELGDGLDEFCGISV